jgi:hypothetical protein
VPALSERKLCTGVSSFIPVAGRGKALSWLEGDCTEAPEPYWLGEATAGAGDS